MILKTYTKIFCYLLFCPLIAHAMVSAGEAGSPPSSLLNMFRTGHSGQLIPDVMDGYGVVFRDINRDGYPDLYLVCFRGINRLLINNGPNRSFTDATNMSGLGGNLMPKGIQNLELGAVAVDIDNDRDCDVVVAGWGVSTDLYLNMGNLTFKDARDQLGYELPLDANGCAAADINLDGLIDLFFTDEHYSNRMFLNIGNGRFKDITKESGLYYMGLSQGASFCDLDLDGDPDLYVTNWFGPDCLYRNDRGIFKTVKLRLEVLNKSISTNSVCFGDVDNDGDYDMFVANREGANYLYLNQIQPGDSAWSFLDASTAAGLTDEGISYGGLLADLDLDGWLDLLVTNIGANRFYRNRGDGTFQKIYEDEQRKGKSGYSTGMAGADYDLDGDPDVFVANKDTFCVFYENPVNRSGYIRILLQGIESNRDAIGARVECYKSGFLGDNSKLLGVREISGGSGYLSMSEPVALFGLGDIEKVDIRVIFPSGIQVNRTGLAAGESVLIHEHAFLSRTLILGGRRIVVLMRSIDFWTQLFLILLFTAITFMLLRLGLRRYHWSAGRASSFLTGIAVVALMVMVVLNPLKLTMRLLFIDLFTLGFVAVLLGYSELLRKSGMMREKYRSVLIGLGNSMVEIKTKSELYRVVVQDVYDSAGLSQCCLLLFDRPQMKIVHTECRGHEISVNRIKKYDKLQSFIQALKSETVLGIKDRGSDHSFFKLCRTDLFFRIARKDNLYGVLGVRHEDRQYIWVQEDLDLFQTLSNQIAVALENIDYIEKSNRMVKRLTETRIQKKYLKELETANRTLDEKNHQLQLLYDELKDKETWLIQSEKMASLGQLVAGISHELNNPVGFIYANVKQLKSYISRIEASLSDPGDNEKKQLKSLLPDIQSLIHDTIQGSQSVKQLVDNLRRFSHLDQAERKISNVHEGIDNCLMILKPILKERIAIHKDFKADGHIECHIGQLNQVFMNLLMNAAQAIEDRGNIWIRTWDENKQLIIEIADDGAGIPGDALGKIFDPFFTTKDIGEGVGLGLSIGYSIVKNHNGTIEVNSEEEKGTTFILTFPHHDTKG